jgi:hypothetical protein
MTDFNKNVILNVKDKGMDSAKRGLQGLNKETDKLLDGMDDIQSSSKKAMEMIGLGADAQVGRLQRLNNALQGMTGRIGAGIGAIDNFAKRLAPWNQAIELGGKAVKFLDGSLESAAKKYPEHAKGIAEMRSQFAGMKEDISAAVGVMVFELARPIRPLEELERRVDALRKKIRGDTSGSSGFVGDDEARDIWGRSGGGSFTESTGVDFFAKLNTQLDTYTKRTTAAAEATKKAAIEAARWRAEWEAMRLAETGSNGRARYFDTIAQQGNGFQINTGLRDQNDQISAAFDDLNRRNAALNEQGTRGSRFAESSGRRNDSYLATMFGPIEEFNAYATAFGTLTTATQTAMQAWISGSESLGAAIKKGLGAALGGLATSLAVESLKHGAYALGSLAFGDIRGAGQHGAAAAAFGAGAAAAAVAAKQLGGSGGSAPAGGGRDQRGGGEGGEGGRGNGGTVNSNRTREAGGVERIYIIDDQFSDLTPRQRMLAIEKKMRDQGRRTHGDDD